ncbi:MAG TPA: hypothetical protein VI585_19000 [Candidatus Binatia bacterium]
MTSYLATNRQLCGGFCQFRVNWYVLLFRRNIAELLLYVLTMMSFSKKSLTTEQGQGLVEYSLIVHLVVLVFWVAVKGTGMGDALANSWDTIEACTGSPFSCGSGS